MEATKYESEHSIYVSSETERSDKEEIVEQLADARIQVVGEFDGDSDDKRSDGDDSEEESDGDGSRNGTRVDTSNDGSGVESEDESEDETSSGDESDDCSECR